MIWDLSRSMGMKQISFFISAFIFMTISMIIYGAVLILTFGLTIMSESDKTIMILGLIGFCYASFFQISVFWTLFGKFGLGLYYVLGFIQLIVTTVFGATTMVPSSIAVPLTVFLFPMLSFSQLLRGMILFQIRYDGMSWSNINKYEIQNNNSLHNLLACICSALFYMILLLYIWPLRYNRDGRKMGLFYCLKPSYWKGR